MGFPVYVNRTHYQGSNRYVDIYAHAYPYLRPQEPRCHHHNYASRPAYRAPTRHHQQQQQRPIDHAGVQVEAISMASSAGRYLPPPDTHNSYNGQDNGSGGGLSEASSAA
ncbi:unnamed protein product [Vitrella brassicaformis CCMP3155]|uniref:Uncharacterized protein n=1 Tax=Vitrella brassicaformis (strain CCMP3155) TaxID=1169540 RepID=A0A0G4EM17_VITBC|nr:unnamed protein product [Vitrella brassicaformis CCMP3155]|eukprot:CEL98022.1 unnamed protein product [Vitrella brassicaformis CCMP3155]